MVASTGEVFSTPFEYLTSRSVFLLGRARLKFDEEVTLEVLGIIVEARVAFVAYDPPGLVLTFEAPPEADKIFRRWQQHRRITWVNEDVRKTADGSDDVDFVASLMDRTPTVSVEARAVDSEEPTNTAARTISSEEKTLPGIMYPTDANNVIKVSQASTKMVGPEGTRLRATTHVDELDSADES
ncbi:MAG: hypothetical protein KTR25_02630 [Myxococcales bacterium]|nr:hypothetical protein [Myxococcales bacterium]